MLDKINISFPFTNIPMATVGLLNTKLGELHDVAGSRFDTDKVLSERQSAYFRILKNMLVKDLFTVALRTVFKLSIYVCTYVCMHVCIYVSMYVCTYVSMYVCKYICMHTYICTYVRK